MELTENERLLLVQKKEEIRKLTEDIIELTENLKENRVEIKKKISGILSLLSVIASYTNSKRMDMLAFAQFAELLFYHNKLNFPKAITTELEFFCNIANSIKFSFTGRGLKVNIPKVDFSIFKTG